MEIITRKQAQQQGLKRYFTGKPCKNEGVAERLVSNNACLCKTCNARRNKVSAAQKAQRFEQDAEFRERTRAMRRAKTLRNYHLRYGSDEVFTQQTKANSRHMKNVRKRARQAVPLTQAEKKTIFSVYKLARKLTKETGIEYHVDHRIPLAKGGLHHPSNLWVITADENLRKHAKLPEELVA